MIWYGNLMKRKMRSGQVPLKIEYFAVKSVECKEKLGYLLLNLRSAQVISKNTDSVVSANWHKLVGSRGHFKMHKPELLLALSVCYREPATLNSKLELKDRELYQQTTESSKIVPVLLHDERLIQLGPINTCYELFLLSIKAISAMNLHSLLPTNCTDINNDLYFWCKLLENDMYFNRPKKDCGDLWVLNEKIVIRIRSSLRVLKDYLELKPFLFIYLKYKEDILGESEVNLQPLVPTDSIEEFLKNTESSSSILQQRCYLRKKNEIDDAKARNSYLDLQLKLQYAGGNTDVVTETANTMISDSLVPNSMKELKTNLNQIKSHASEIDCHRNPAGDFGKYSTDAPLVNFTNKYNNINKPSLNCEFNKKQFIETACSQSTDVLPSNINDYSNSVEAYHCYCLNIRFIAIKLRSPVLVTKAAEIRLHHPKTEIVSTFYPNIPFSLGEKIKLQDIGCKLHFISAIDEIKQLLLSFPPKITIHKEEGNSKICICQSIVDIKQLFYQNKAEYLCDVPLYDMEQNIVGNLDVLLNLEDCGPYYRIGKNAQSEYLGPPILDDSLAYKIVDELETWKERQMEIFKVELKRKEDRHLNLLSQEWQKHKENLEAKLACSVNQCKMLANSLSNATEDLKTRRLKSLEKETKLVKANEDLQCRYESTIKKLKESFHSMQEELTTKIDILEKKKTTLEAQIDQLSNENERLQLTVMKQSEELESYQKGSLTQDQTTNLLLELKILEEKLQNAQENKSFFKEQWAKAVREMHCMRREFQEARQVQIKSSKEQLQNLDLEEILSADSNALTNDQVLLSEIQKEIDVIKPKSSFTDKGVYCQVFTPTSVDSKIMPNSNKSTLKKSEEYDKRLQALLEERNSLLKTGSYTIDDTVIMKLNAEIRSLMMK
ncbi:rha isoform X2 [Megachile rotundata]|uniref:rha isoform X2 n=1 Tax=Megachile rotundata TaxID=143995 RepID=UPI003FD02CB1